MVYSHPWTPKLSLPKGYCAGNLSRLREQARSTLETKGEADGE